MNTSDDLITLARLAGGLVVVLTLVYLSARIAKRKGLRRGDTGLKVVDRVGLSRDAHLAVVEVGGRTMLLGVTSQSVTMLRALDEEEQPAAEPAVVTLPDILPEVDELVDEIGADIPRPAVEPNLPESPSARPDPMPAGITLDQYPDLASALRAAGRTATHPEERMPVGPPRTRAEARRRSKALEDAERALEEAEAALKARQQAKNQPATIPQQRTAKSPPVRRTVAQPQASGSVLNPKTWQQGIDALREYTVRRG